MFGIRVRWFGALGLALWVGLCAQGCSDDGSTVDAAVDGPTVVDGPPAVDMGQDVAVGESQTFIVAERTEASKPLQGATVALDPPGGGERIEKKTDADGKVTFDIDWTAGDVTVTGHLDGYAMETFTNLNPARIAAMPDSRKEGEALKILLYPLVSTAPESVSVSGTVTGLKDPAHDVVVNVQRSTVASEWKGTATETFKVTAPKGADFVLQGLEMEDSVILPSGQGYQMTIHQVAHQAVNAVAQDTTGVALDFAAHAVATQTADATVVLPKRKDSPLRVGWPNCYVFNPESSYSNGWSKQVEVQPAQDQLAVTFIWTEPTWAQELSTYCRVSNAVTGDVSVMREKGCPKAGAITQPMLDVPRWVTPDSTATAHPLFSTMEWELFDKNTGTYLIYYKGKQLVWLVLMGPDATSVVVPQPPSSVDKTALFGSGTLSAVVGGEKYVSDGSYYRSASSQGRLIQP
jgi:hypothetical protein